MKVKLVAPVLAALGVLLGASTSEAGLFSSCCQSSCNQDNCNYPRVRYKTCYQTVVEEKQVTTCKTVQKTIMKECRYTVCKPVEETQIRECRKIVCKPVWEEKQIKVCCGEWKCEWYCQPGHCVTRRHIVCNRDCGNQGCGNQGCGDQCGGCGGCGGHRHLLPRFEVVCNQEQTAAKWCSRKVWVPREETRTVRVCKMQQQEVVEKVPVKVCKMVQEQVVKQVPVTVCEKVPCTETVRVCRRVKTCVPVCEENRCHRCLFSGLFNHGCGNNCGNCGSSNYCDTTAAPAPAPAPLPGEKIPAPTKK
jgi:hypothetical protein